MKNSSICIVQIQEKVKFTGDNTLLLEATIKFDGNTKEISFFKNCKDCKLIAMGNV